IFMPDRAEQNETHRRRRNILCDALFSLFENSFDELVEFLLESLRGHRLSAIANRVRIQRWVATSIGQFLQACGHSITEKYDRRLDERDLLFEPIEPFCGW